jgi:hypothetical protein
MAFDRSNIALADAGLNSGLPRRWSYTSIDTDTAISTAGYFNDASDLVKVGDVITVNADTDGTPLYGRMLVNANSGGVVDVSDVEAFTTTDTE